MSEKMMDEFEMVFPMPNHVTRCGKGYVATEYGAWQANDYCQKWIGWQASRAALVVELPDSLEHTSAWYDYASEAFDETIESVKAALDAAGISYK
jgi:hypothetical protein